MIKVRKLKVDKKKKKGSKGKVKCSLEELNVKRSEEFAKWSLG